MHSKYNCIVLSKYIVMVMTVDMMNLHLYKLDTIQVISYIYLGDKLYIFRWRQQTSS